LIDFLERSVPDAAKLAERTRMRLRTRANLLRIRANPGSGTVVGTSVVLAQVFLVLSD
jgi:hypothetical protein